ncbi:hypothetical protein PS645_05088 [Pseudomonas fluorescens]|uniref:Uncharacterized protein n=1 Tax=Pseudomonas fluorescens TaxID=294 RepID=A0A5E6X2I6_PSEFL|nr:hypothetical protein PS645_05088 [Pseudomonas fluorescens]
MQPLQHLQFIVRPQSTPGFINAQLLRNAGDHRRAIARQQQRPPAARLAGSEQRGRIFAQAIVEHQPRQRCIHVAKQQPLAGFVGHRGNNGATELADKFWLTDPQALLAYQAFKAQSRRAMNVFCRQWCTAKRPGDRVFGTIFEGGGKIQALIAVERAERADRTQGQATLGERTGLVENHRIDLIQSFQYVAAGQQQTEFVQGAGGGGECGRCGQGQRARAGRDQHGEDDPERARGVQLPPDQTDDSSGNKRQQQKPLRGPVGNFRQSRLFGLSAVEQANDR